MSVKSNHNFDICYGTKLREYQTTVIVHHDPDAKHIDGTTVTSLPSVFVDITIEYVPINILLLWPYRRKCKSTVDEDTVRYA